MQSAVLLLRVVLAAVFATASVGKFLDREGSRQALRDFGVPGAFVDRGAVLLPALEMAVAVAMLVAVTAVAGAVAAALLLGAFCVGIAAAMARGEAPQCHCFGQLHSEPAGPRTLARNGVLAALAVLVAAAGPGPEIPSWLSARSLAELIVLALAAVVLIVLVLLLRQRAAVRAAEKATEAPGLEIGAAAPAFELASVDGGAVTLSELTEPGLPLVLVFTHPQCGPCQQLMPDLARWQRTLSERLTITVMSQGELTDNIEKKSAVGLGTVLVEPGMDVYNAYRMKGTPSAVALAPDGSIWSATAQGQVPIEELIRMVIGRTPAPAPAAMAAGAQPVA